MGCWSAVGSRGKDNDEIRKMIFAGAFFEAKKQAALAQGNDNNDYEKQLASAYEKCTDICAGNKFSQRPDQNSMERSIVDSCLARIELGRQLSDKQMDQINKMSHRQGPVMFCGHRK